MSTQPESKELDLDLDIELLPAWAQKPASENQYSRFEGRGVDSPRDRRGGMSDRPPRRDGGPRRDRPSGPGAGPKRSFDPSRRDRGPRDAGTGSRDDARRLPPREPAAPPVQLSINLTPEARGVESLAKQIRLTGRAYPLFDIAFMVLKRPDRYMAEFGVIRGPDGKVAQQMFWCELDQTLWLSEPEAIQHVLTKHFELFYKADRIQTDPPKGTYTFVAQCGISGAILGPPNYHDYQNKLRKLHADRFARMPFEEYKSRIKIVKDEAVVKKWIDDQSWRTEDVCLNVPESVRLPNRDEVERHFRETHMASVIKPVDNCAMKGAAVQLLPSRPLQALLRNAWEEQMRFPIKMATHLSQQFANHGLQFFKVNRTVTHVAVARPHYLDLNATPVSDGVKKIVEFIDSDREATRRKLLAALVQAKPVDPALPPEQATDPETSRVNSDLHWLIHQGHVIEFANGRLELAKKPIVKPPPAPAAKPAEKPQETTTESAPAASVEGAPESAAVETIASTEPAPAPETSASTEPIAPAESTPQAG